MRLILLFLIPFIFCCSTDKDDAENIDEAIEMTQTTGKASVTKVEVSGDPNAYTFNVTILSPDTGCEQYADWWEVIDFDGNLIYRRLLAHSHVEKQPFTRSGGAIDISEMTEVYIRVHMNTSGYASSIQKGSVINGFTNSELDSDFATALQEVTPLPEGCAF